MQTEANMEQYTTKGVVEVVRQNDKSGMWSFKVGDYWYGAGKYQPKFSQGDEIEFDYSMRGEYRNLVFKTVTVLGRGTGGAAASAPAQVASGTNWDLKDKRITFLACRKDAIQLATIAADKDAITLPTKKSDRLAVIMELVNTLTNDLYEQVYDSPFNGE